MKIYRISQEINNGCDTFDAAIVAAESEDDARTISPDSYVTHVKDGQWMRTYSAGKKAGQEYVSGSDAWVPYSQIYQIKVEYFGETDQPRGVLLASFNAG